MRLARGLRFVELVEQVLGWDEGSLLRLWVQGLGFGFMLCHSEHRGVTGRGFAVPGQKTHWPHIPSMSTSGFFFLCKPGAQIFVC